MIPPAVIDVAIREKGKKGFRIWLPLFLFWPLLLVLLVLAGIAAILTDIVMYAMGRPYHHYTLLLLAIGQMFSEVWGTRVHVSGDSRIRIVIS